MKKYVKTMQMAMGKQLNTGVLYFLPEYLLRVLRLIPLMFLWNVLMAQGVSVEMTAEQMLAYTYLSSLLAPLLDISSPLTDWVYDGLLTGVYQRPAAVYGGIAAQTFGGLLPGFLFYTIPMFVVGCLAGLALYPVTMWALISLMLCIGIGFAIDLLFASFMICIGGNRWLVIQFRRTAAVVFSGSLIPFVLLPGNIGAYMKFLPYGCMGGAVLSIYTGIEQAGPLIAAQVLWIIILWPAAVLALKVSRERLVCNGG